MILRDYDKRIPQVGDITHGYNIGLSSRHLYIFTVCPICKETRWVFLLHGKPKTEKCRKCACGEKEHKDRLSVAQKKRIAEDRNSTMFQKGHIPTEDMRHKMGAKKEKHHLWKGGITEDRQRYRQILKSRNPEKIKAYFKEWKHNHKESIKAYNQNRRAYELNAEGSFTPKEWEAKKLEHGNVCANCGTSGKLTVDHIIPLSRGGSNWIDNIQPLCLSCNCMKHDLLMDEFEVYQIKKLTNMLKDIKTLLQHEWETYNQEIINGGLDMSIENAKCDYIHYLQDQFDKLTGRVKFESN